MQGQIDVGIDDAPLVKKHHDVITTMHDVIEAAGAAHLTDVEAFESLLKWFDSPKFGEWYDYSPLRMFKSAYNAKAMILRYRLTGRFK